MKTDTIAAVATAMSDSGIGIVRISGDEAILLLHGHPETYLIWRDIAPTLAKYYRVVATDLRGYGDSSKPKGLTKCS